MLAYMLDEREFLSPYGVRAVSSYHLDHPFVLQLGRPGISVGLRAGRIDDRPVRRQLELARADLVSGQFPDHPGAARISPLLRQQLSGRMPDGLRANENAWSRSPTNWRGGWPAFFFAMRKASGQCSVIRKLFNNDPELERSDSVLRVFPWRHGPRLRRQPSNRLDRTDRPRS